MGRHSAPDDDEVDAAADSGHGAVAVDEHAQDSAPGGRHSSPPPEDVVPDAEDEDGPRTEGLELIEDVLDGPDSDPMPVADQPRRPAPGQPEAERPHPDAGPAALHDAPTERIPTVGPDPALERTDRIPTVAGTDDGEPGGGVSEVGLDSAGPVLASPDDPAPATAAAEPSGKAAKRRGTVSDLTLLRRHGDVRARVIAAVVVPFALYFGVFALAGELSVRRLIWVWIPAVTAGVLVGLLLDAGHRRYPDAEPVAREPGDRTPEPRTR